MRRLDVLLICPHGRFTRKLAQTLKEGYTKYQVAEYEPGSDFAEMDFGDGWPTELNTRQLMGALEAGSYGLAVLIHEDNVNLEEIPWRLRPRVVILWSEMPGHIGDYQGLGFEHFCTEENLIATIREAAALIPEEAR